MTTNENNDPLGELPPSIPKWVPPDSFIKFRILDDKTFECTSCKQSGLREGWTSKNLCASLCNNCKIRANHEDDEKPEVIPGAIAAVASDIITKEFDYPKLTGRKFRINTKKGNAWKFAR